MDIVRPIPLLTPRKKSKRGKKLGPRFGRWFDSMARFLRLRGRRNSSLGHPRPDSKYPSKTIYPFNSGIDGCPNFDALSPSDLDDEDDDDDEEEEEVENNEEQSRNRSRKTLLRLVIKPIKGALIPENIEVVRPRPRSGARSVGDVQELERIYNEPDVVVAPANNNNNNNADDAQQGAAAAAADAASSAEDGMVVNENGMRVEIVAAAMVQIPPYGGLPEIVYMNVEDEPPYQNLEYGDRGNPLQLVPANAQQVARAANEGMSLQDVLNIVQADQAEHPEGVAYRKMAMMVNVVHSRVDYLHRLVPGMDAITRCSYYWGKIDRYGAEKLLENKPEGTFLLRDSAQDDHIFAVSFRRFDRSLHARIELTTNREFTFDSHDPGVFAAPSVVELIAHYKDPEHCMFFEPMLTRSLQRRFVFSLKHLARVAIMPMTTYDDIDQLVVPRSLQDYLKEYHYKVKVKNNDFSIDAQVVDK